MFSYFHKMKLLSSNKYGNKKFYWLSMINERGVFVCGQCLNKHVYRLPCFCFSTLWEKRTCGLLMVQPAVRTQDQSNGKLKFADYTTEKMAQYTKTG